MNDLLNNFVLGIVSGLVTTLLLLIFRAWWLGQLLPWYEERIYQDCRIDKMWFASCSIIGSDEPERLRWELKQVAHKISGQVVCLNGPDEGSVYAIEGVFKNLILAATYRPTNNNSLNRGTVALMLTNNGRTLKGQCAFYSAAGNEILNTPYECERTQ